MTIGEKSRRNSLEYKQQQISLRLECIRFTMIDMPIDERLKAAQKLYEFLIGETTTPTKEGE